MNNINDINEVIKRAKHQRAEFIGSAVQAYALPAVLVAGLSLMLLQFGGSPAGQPTEAVAKVAQVTSASR
jgi:hypothetical protein